MHNRFGFPKFPINKCPGDQLDKCNEELGSNISIRNTLLGMNKVKFNVYFIYDYERKY